jgi:hypothetical protein
VPTTRRGSRVLTAGAVASFAIALLHVGMVPVGEPAYEYFTAPERLIVLAREGSLVPAVVTIGIAVVFGGFGVSALLGARHDLRPGLRILLVGITGTYLLRGFLIVPELVVVQHAGYPARMMVFSTAALVVGLVHLAGLALSWGRLGAPDRMELPPSESSDKSASL